jgi:hypothetical protein
MILHCPACHELKSKLDVAVALSVKATTVLLRMDNDAPHRSVVMAAMQKFNEKLHECERLYEKHVSKHPRNDGSPWRIEYPRGFSLN